MPDQTAKLLETLKARFEANPNRHPDLSWDSVAEKLESNARALKALQAMEESGGEPDIIEFQGESAGTHLVDCSEQSPKGRRSLCYDQAALDSRKEHKPGGNAVSTAKELGIELLTEDQYYQLQKLGEFDTKSSSWVLSPADFRKEGGALFCDRRFGRVFTYCNGAESYYAARGFRGAFKL